jgi:glycosyltransferase involved in cell wall biosynthesis
MPLVSVVLPVRNAVATVARAVVSIRRQTFSDWELVVVDDGSTDGTRGWLRAAARKDPRLRLIERPAEGIVAALNAGLGAARGEFVARMDADDESHAERLEAQVEYLRRHHEVGVVGCQVDYGGDRGKNAGYALHVDWLNSLVTPEEIALNRFVESPLAHPSVMFRRALAERHGAYRAGDFPEDYELWLRWLAAGVRLAKVPRTLLTWHDPPVRLSRTDRRYAPEAFFRIKAEYIARWLAEPVGRDRQIPPGKISAGQATPPYREIWVWGAGRPTRKRAAHLESHGVQIAGYIDVDAKKTGRGIGGTGLPVLAPTDLPPPGRIFVLGYVSSRGARADIRAELVCRGYVEGRDFLMCA